MEGGGGGGMVGVWVEGRRALPVLVFSYILQITVA